MNEVKKCPICEETKSTNEFYLYYSKVRDTTRVSNYCKPCGKVKSNARAKIYYQKNKERCRASSKAYRVKNKESIRIKKREFKRKYSKELHDVYVSEYAAKALKTTMEEVRKNPELIEAYRNNMKIKRIIREHNGKE